MRNGLHGLGHAPRDRLAHRIVRDLRRRSRARTVCASPRVGHARDRRCDRRRPTRRVAAAGERRLHIALDDAAMRAGAGQRGQDRARLPWPAAAPAAKRRCAAPPGASRSSPESAMRSTYREPPSPPRSPRRRKAEPASRDWRRRAWARPCRSRAAPARRDNRTPPPARARRSPRLCRIAASPPPPRRSGRSSSPIR